jgi:hypothetical protein
MRPVRDDDSEPAALADAARVKINRLLEAAGWRFFPRRADRRFIDFEIDAGGTQARRIIERELAVAAHGTILPWFLVRAPEFGVNTTRGMRLGNAGVPPAFFQCSTTRKTAGGTPALPGLISWVCLPVQ